MAKAGKRHPLLLYTRMMDRWWPPIFWIGAATLALAWWRYQDVYLRLTEPWQWMALAGAGALSILASLLMLALRKSAYVRAYGDHFLLATPFLRMNVSYRRIRRTTTASMDSLFPTRRMSFLKRDTIAPLLKRTAVIVDLNALPMPRSALRLFLSPFFFKDQTPHLVILVADWMGFSTQLESMRAAGNAPAVTDRKSRQSLLSQLPHR
jgi:hypothetical protein